MRDNKLSLYVDSLGKDRFRVTLMYPLIRTHKIKRDDGGTTQHYTHPTMEFDVQYQQGEISCSTPIICNLDLEGYIRLTEKLLRDKDFQEKIVEKIKEI